MNEYLERGEININGQDEHLEKKGGKQERNIWKEDKDGNLETKLRT